MSATKTRHPAAPVTVKQGAPSASGEKVDTGKAKVIPPSPEVKAEAGKRDPDPVKKVAAKIEADAAAKTEQIKNANAESLARDEQDRKEAVLEMADDAEAASEGHKRTKAVKRANVSAHRLTNLWASKTGRDVAIKDKVKLADGTVVTCVGRWTKKTKQGNVPFITCTTADGTRRNSAASEVTHVAKK